MCPFCKSKMDKVVRVSNRNRGRERIMLHVRCNKCYARGPIVSLPANSKDYEIEEAEEVAMKLWYQPIMRYAYKGTDKERT